MPVQPEASSCAQALAGYCHCPPRGPGGPSPSLGGSSLPGAPGMCLFLSNISQLTGNRREQEYTLKEPAAQGQGQNKSA